MRFFFLIESFIGTAYFELINVFVTSSFMLFLYIAFLQCFLIIIMDKFQFFEIFF